MERIPRRFHVGNLLRSSYWRYVIAAAVVFFCFVSGVEAESQKQGLAKGYFTYFYKQPDLEGIPGFLSLIDATGPLKADDAPPIMGFLSALFERHPDRVDSWIVGTHSRQVQQMVGFSLALAGMPDKTVEYLKKNGWAPAQIDRIFGQMFLAKPDLLSTSPPTSPTDLDALWGASFATGDPAYPDKIVDLVDGAVRSGKYGVDDIMYFAPPPQKLSEIKDSPVLNSILRRYQRSGLNDLILNGVAIWGLGSNAVQHEFVMELIQERIAQAPNSDLSYMLRKSIFRSSHSIGASVKGGEIRGIVSLTTQTELKGVSRLSSSAESVKAMFDSLLPIFGNEFERGDPVSIIVLLVIPPGAHIDLMFKISSPNGSSFVLEPSTWHALGQQHQVSAMLLPLDPSRLTEEGVYRVEGVLIDGGQEKLETKNAFFFGKR